MSQSSLSHQISASAPCSYHENINPTPFLYCWLLGYRMACPQRCPDDVYKVMQRCWQYNPEDRPKFSELQRDLAAIKKKWWCHHTPHHHQEEVMMSSYTSPPSGRSDDVITHLTAIRKKWWCHHSPGHFMRHKKNIQLRPQYQSPAKSYFFYRWAWSLCGRGLHVGVSLQ